MILLTGATGFLGMTVLGQLLEEDREVIAVVRATDQAHADARIDEALASLYGHVPPTRELVRAVPGDLLVEGLGLSAADARLVATRADAVVHCAASVEFTLPLPEAMEVNAHGTSHVLELARRVPGCAAWCTSPRRTCPATVPAASTSTTSSWARSSATATSSPSTPPSGGCSPRATCRS